jgi:hypothetical protein
MSDGRSPSILLPGRLYAGHPMGLEGSDQWWRVSTARHAYATISVVMH